MIGNSREDACLAAAAHALETRIGCIYPVLEERIQNRFSGLNPDDTDRPGKPDIEAPVVVGAVGIGEELDMGLPRRQGCGRLLEAGEHVSRAATIDVGIAGNLGNDLGKVDPPCRRFAVKFVRKVEFHLRAVGCKLPNEAGRASAARRIMQLPGPAKLLQPAYHAGERSDADATGDQDRSWGIFTKPEIIQRLADLDLVSGVKLFVNETRAAPAIRLLPDANHVAVGLARTIHQRVASDQTVSEAKVELGARRKRRQGRPVGSTKFKQIDVLGLARNVFQFSLDHGEATSASFMPPPDFRADATRWGFGCRVTSRPPRDDS